MQRLDPLLYVLVFLGVVFCLEGLFLLLAGGRRERERRTAERLRRYAAQLGSDELSDDGKTILREKTGSGWRARLPVAHRLELFLYRAGMPFGIVTFLLLSVGLTASGVFVGLSVLREPIQAGALACAGLLPTLFVAYRRRARRTRLEQQFPDAMDLLCRSLRAGHSLRASFHMVGEEIGDPIGTEFGQVADEVSFGLDLRDALRNLAHRVDHPDMPFFINAVMIQRETGGNLAEILQSMARVVRERLRFFGRVRALLAQIKLTANVLAVIPLVMVFAVNMVNPKYMAPLFETEPGKLLAYLAGGLVVAGWILCRRLSVVKY